MIADLRLTLTGAAATAAAATALAGLFADGSAWWRWALTAVLTVTVGVLAARVLRLPEPLVTLAGAGALALVVTALAAREQAVLGLLPGPEAVAALQAAFAAGAEDVVQLAVPVPATPGLLLVTAAGVGAAALAVDALAAGARRPALAGVPLLALVVVPSGLVPGGIGWLPFTLAAGGWLALLLADDQSRTSRWGRLVAAPAPAPGVGALGVRPDSAAGSSTRPLGADPRAHAGRRIGVAALGVSLVAPLLVPSGLQGRLQGGSGWGGLGRVGSASVDTYNPIVRLKGELTRPEPRTVLRVRTTDPDYLRLTALDLYDGSTWSQSPLTAPRSQRVGDGVPLPPGLTPSATRTATATVEVVDLSTRWLPVHYSPRQVDVRGDWRYDGPSRTVFSSRDETAALPPYTVKSARMDVSPDALDGTRSRVDDSLLPFLELPPLPNAVVATADRVTAEAENDYEKAVALQEFFRSTDFVYDEQVPEGNSGNDLLDFLVNRRGYCEQFAAAMAVMARAEGLPARVAIGYTAGREVEPGVWEVSSHDAHAWPEVHLPGVGWIRFEPTPRDDNASPAPPYSIPPEPVEPAALPELLAPAPDPGGPAAPAQPGAASAGTSEPTAAERDGRAGLVALGLLVVLLLAGTPAAVHLVRLRRAWNPPRATAGRAPRGPVPDGATAGAVGVRGQAVTADPGDELARRRAEVAWQQVREAAVDLGLPWRDSDAPRAAAARLVREGGLSGESGMAVQRLASALEVARYSPRAPRSEGLRADGREVRAGLRAGVPKGVRWRATLLPRSTVQAASRAVGSAVADLLDLLDDAGARLRGGGSGGGPDAWRAAGRPSLPTRPRVAASAPSLPRGR